MRGLVALLLFAVGIVSARADEAPLALQRAVVDTGGAQARVCLSFDGKLSGSVEAHYADYVRLSPAASPAIEAHDKDLCLSGLAFGQSYDITMRAGLKAADGRSLAADRTVHVALADRSPLVAISGDGFILSRQTSTGVVIDSVNVARVRVHVLRMSPRMLATDPSKLADPGRTMRGDSLLEIVRQQAQLVWSGTMDVKSDRNRTVQTAFPIAQIIADKPPAAYLVLAENAARPKSKFFSDKVEDGDDWPDWVSDTEFAARWLISTDLTLTSFEGLDGLHVFVRSLATARPVAGVTVTLLSVGLDTLQSATTGSDGGASFPAGLLHGHGAMRARTLTALTPAGDYTIASLDRPAFDFSDRGVSGRAAAGPVQAFIATDRGVYRPGETIHLTTLLRDRRGDALQAGSTLTVRRPDGVAFRTMVLASASDGGTASSVTLTGSAARGHWTAELRLDPGEPAVGSAGFEVQDFVPQQLAVHVTGVPSRLSPGAKLAFAVDGRFLYGAPAAGLHAEATLRVARDDAPVADAPPGYAFGIADETVDEDEQMLDVSDADDQGHAASSDDFKVPATVSVPLRATLTAGLFEPSGRLVSDTAMFHIRNQATLIGVRARVPAGFAERTQASFDVLTYDGDAKPAAARGLQWSIIRENRVFDWLEIDGSWTFHYHTVDEPIASGSFDTEAGRAASLTHDLDWGHYRFVATDPRTGVASSTGFDIGWSDVAAGADTPDKLEITAPSDHVAAGGTVHLHIKGLFAGRAQIVVANDRVIETRDIDLPAAGAELAVTANADWGAGAYVMATLYRPLGVPAARAHLPIRAVGLAYVGVDERAHTLSVSLGAPTSVRPRTTVMVPIHVGGAAGEGFVTLAAVDEGILQLTRYATPDPAGFLFGKQRLGIEMRDDYGRLLDGDAPPGALREGGDEGIGGPSLPVTSTKIVSLFTGPVALDANGDAKVPLAIPDFEGELRLVAIAWNAHVVGAAGTPMTVRDPVFAQADLPRFLAPGDVALIQVGLVDNDRPGPYLLSVSATGAARLEARPVAAMLAAGTRRQLTATLTGTDVGVATIATDLTGADGFRQRRTWQIAVRAAHFPVTLTDTQAQAPGQSVRVDPRQLASFVPGSVDVSISYAGYRGLDASSLLQALYRYPFGCTEQLASTAWPLVYFNDPGLLGRLPRDAGASARVQTAIDTIIDREDPAGRFGLWRVGDGEASPWLDAYATDFLMHAKEAGFAVPDETLDRALGWIGQEVEQTDQYQNEYAADQDNSRAYGWYVLARAGRADPGAIRRAQQSLAAGGVGADAGAADVVSWGGRTDPAGPLSLAHLAGALSMVGEHDRAQQTFALARANLGWVRTWRGWPDWWFDFGYFSYRRDLAAVTAIAADSGDDGLAQSLIDQFQAPDWNDRFLSTQEAAWLLAAAHALNRDQPGRAVTADGHLVAPLKLPAAFAPTTAQIAAGYAVVNTGTKALWRTLSITGAPRDAFPALASGYHLDRQALTLDGKPLDITHLRQNDRFLVVLHGGADDAADHRTVLVDLLPAGWEIEAPVSRAQQVPFLGALTRTRVAEARDDRYVAAFDLGRGLRGEAVTEVDGTAPAPLGGGEFRVAYIVRVVTPGRFTRPEAVVSDMYRPQVTARTESGETTADPR